MANERFNQLPHNTHVLAARLREKRHMDTIAWESVGTRLCRGHYSGRSIMMYLCQNSTLALCMDEEAPTHALTATNIDQLHAAATTWLYHGEHDAGFLGQEADYAPRTTWRLDMESGVQGPDSIIEGLPALLCRLRSEPMSRNLVIGQNAEHDSVFVGVQRGEVQFFLLCTIERFVPSGNAHHLRFVANWEVPHSRPVGVFHLFARASDQVWEQLSDLATTVDSGSVLACAQSLAEESLEMTTPPDLSSHEPGSLSGAWTLDDI